MTFYESNPSASGRQDVQNGGKITRVLGAIIDGSLTIGDRLTGYRAIQSPGLAQDSSDIHEQRFPTTRPNVTEPNILVRVVGGAIDAALLLGDKVGISNNLEPQPIIHSNDKAEQRPAANESRNN